MKLYNRYILTVATALLLTTVLMIAGGLNALEIYFTVYVLEALAISELYVYFDNRARRGLTYVNTILFGCFTVALCLQLLKILT